MSNSINIAILGENGQARQSMASLIGKKASSDDLGFYHTVFGGKIVNVVETSTYPTKLSSLIETINLCDIALVVADKLNTPLGEIIVALSLTQIPAVFVTNLDLTKLLQGTTLNNSKIFDDSKAAIEYLLSIEPQLKSGYSLAYIDHCFEVKGVGTVALGVVKQGEIKVHDKLTAYPQNIEIEVKSIQKNDDDVQTSFSSDRVGLAIKGTKSEQIGRGTLISSKQIEIATKLSGKFTISSFVKETPKENDVIHMAIGLNLLPARILKIVAQNDGVQMDFEFEKPFAYDDFQKVIVCNLNAKTLRIIGISQNGTVTTNI